MWIITSFIVRSIPQTETTPASPVAVCAEIDWVFWREEHCVTDGWFLTILSWLIFNKHKWNGLVILQPIGYTFLKFISIVFVIMSNCVKTFKKTFYIALETNRWFLNFLKLHHYHSCSISNYYVWYPGGKYAIWCTNQLSSLCFILSKAYMGNSKS